MYVESFEKLSGNDMFEGFAVDLAHELSLVLGFNYTIKLVDDGKVHRFDGKNNQTFSRQGQAHELRINSCSCKM